MARHRARARACDTGTASRSASRPARLLVAALGMRPDRGRGHGERRRRAPTPSRWPRSPSRSTPACCRRSATAPRPRNCSSCCCPTGRVPRPPPAGRVPPLGRLGRRRPHRVERHRCRATGAGLRRRQRRVPAGDDRPDGPTDRIVPRRDLGRQDGHPLPQGQRADSWISTRSASCSWGRRRAVTSRRSSAATAGTFEPPNLPAPLRKVDSTVAAVVDIVGPSDLTTFERTAHPWAASLTASFLGCPTPTPGAVLTCYEEALRTASVATYLDPSDPPIYLAYGAQDTLVVPATQGAAVGGRVGTRTPRQHHDRVVPRRSHRRSQYLPGRGRVDPRHLDRHPRRPRRQALDGDGARGSRGTQQPEFESVTGERGTAVAAELDLQVGSAPFDGPEAHVFGPCDFRIGVAACEQREQPHLGVGQFERRRGAVRVLRGQCGTELRLEVGTSGGHVPDRGEERVDVGRLQRVTGRAGAQRALTEVPVGVSAIPQLGSGNPQLPGW